MTAAGAFCSEHPGGTAAPCDACASARRLTRDHCEGGVALEAEADVPAIAQIEPHDDRSALDLGAVEVAGDKPAVEVVVRIFGELEDGTVVVELSRHGAELIDDGKAAAIAAERAS